MPSPANVESVPVQHPTVGPHIRMERDVDGVDRGRQRAVGVGLADARVGPHRSGNRGVAGKVREQSGV